MSEQTTLLEKLEGLLIRFEEIGTLITDPAVIGDMKRFVKLTKEYRDLEKISEAAKRYKQILNGIEESRRLLETENDPEMRDMAKEELDSCTSQLPQLEEEIKLLLVPADPEGSKNAIVEIRGGTGGDEAAFSRETYSACMLNIAKPKVGKPKSAVTARERPADTKKSFSQYRAIMYTAHSNMNREYTEYKESLPPRHKAASTPLRQQWLSCPKLQNLMSK